ncbi:MAG: hypothetical protein IKE23_02235, partial [Exiguobacterium sp.]|nr:hypothetical protein [Exiguobacterium sp.]
PFVAIVGESEMAEGKVNLKNMITGEQQMIAPADIASAICK